MNHERPTPDGLDGPAAEPEAPESPEAPETPESPEAPETPESPEAPTVRWAPPASAAPGSWANPGPTRMPGTTETGGTAGTGWEAPPPSSGLGVDVGALISRTFHVFGAEWSLFLVVMAPLALGYAVMFALTAQGAADLSPDQVVYAVISTVVLIPVALLSTTTTVVLADAIADGRELSIGAAVRSAAPGAVRLVGVGIVLLGVAFVFALLLGLVFAAGAASPALGLVGLVFVLVAFPVLIIASIRLTMLVPVVALERVGPIDAIRRTWSVSRRRVIATFVLVFALSLVTGLASMGVGLLGLWPGLLPAIGVGLAVAVSTPPAVIGVTLLYRECAGRAGGDGWRGPTRGARTALVLVLGIGAVTAGAGVAVTGDNIGALLDRAGTGTFPGGGGFLPEPVDPGVVRFGGGFNMFDLCAPGDQAAEFSVDDEIWFGGYFSAPVQAADRVTLTLTIDDEVLLDDEPVEPVFLPGGVACYGEVSPLIVPFPGEYEMVFEANGAVVARGSFVAR